MRANILQRFFGSHGITALGCAASLGLTTSASAAEPVVAEEPPEAADAARPAAGFALEHGGYAELLFGFHNYGANQNLEGGAQRDARLVFDATRFVVEFEGEMPWQIDFEAEIELEHGGTGSEMELDFEEFGEFEHEIAKGGEVLVEELWVRKRFGDHFALKAGRFYLALGTLFSDTRPTAYLATTRSEAETTVIPAVWDEMGLELQASFEKLRLTAQVVNGLDSTGFSSRFWVASGHQKRFELVRATDLAGVARVDFLPARDVELGVSAYYGGTSRNRPKPDLVRECDDADPSEVAPCGYVEASLLILDAHARFEIGPLRGNALLLWGNLENAQAISERNKRLSNALQVARTPVAEQAIAAWGELGYDVAPLLSLAEAHRLEPFFRFDYYDTMFAVPEGTFDNPRFERYVATAGVAYTLADAFYLKLDGSHRWFGKSAGEGGEAIALRPETSIRLGTGFVF